MKKIKLVSVDRVFAKDLDLKEFLLNNSKEDRDLFVSAIIKSYEELIDLLASRIRSNAITSDDLKLIERAGELKLAIRIIKAENFKDYKVKELFI